MKQFTYVIKDPVGIHARPAGLLAKLVKADLKTSKVTLAANGKEADVTRLMAVMQRGIQTGAEVTVKVEGPDEEAHAALIEEFLKNNL